MGNLCVSMHFSACCTPCITFMLVAHTCTFVIDPAEQGRVKPPEPAPVETADYNQRPRQAPVHLTAILKFILSFAIIFVILECALSYRS
jgi:uncharacterized protein with PQ loop repeat